MPKLLLVFGVLGAIAGLLLITRGGIGALIQGTLNIFIGLWTARYRHYFRVSLIDGTAFRKHDEVQLVWHSEAVLANSLNRNPEHPLLTLDRLLAAALKHFGESEKYDQVWNF